MITLDEAWARLESSVAPMDTETVELAESLGRILAEPVAADRDFPATDRSAMDGYAVRSADAAVPGAQLRIVGEQPAGRPAGRELLRGEAMRIYTGAVVPPGADAVVMIERTQAEAGAQAELVAIEIAVEPGSHIRKQGSDLGAGAAVLAAGVRIGPAEIAALASVGRIEVPVARRPTAAVLSTGEEVIEAEERPAPHQVRNSNAPMLQALLRGCGCAARYLGVAGDTRESLVSSIRDGLNRDLLLLTGGVSVGAYDLVAESLEAVGAELLFHGVAVKPGKPILVARADDCWIFGLPGNPVSAFAGFHLFVRPAALRMEADPRWKPAHVAVELTEAIRCRPGRRTYHLARIVEQAGTRRGARVQATGSGDVLALTRANGFLVTDERTESVDAGTMLPALMLPD